MSTRPREALVPDPSPCREAANTGKKPTSQGVPSSGGPRYRGMKAATPPGRRESNCRDIGLQNESPTLQTTHSNRKGKLRFPHRHTQLSECKILSFPLLSFPEWDGTHPTPNYPGLRNPLKTALGSHSLVRSHASSQQIQ